jgi:di/tricarboxylate transporter
MLSAEMNIWMVISTLIAMIILLITDKIRSSLIFIGGVSFLVICEVMTVETVVRSLANKQLLTIFLIIFLSAIIQQSFNIHHWLDKLFIKSRDGKGFLLRMNLVVAAMSSVFNNTPVVVMFMPYVYRWAKRFGVAPSRLLIPLSFSAILGGMITLVGTSTNLVLNGFLQAYQEPLLSFSDFFYLGVLLSVCGIAYMYFWGYTQLEGRITLAEEVREHSREYFVEVRLSKGSKYVGQTISESQLRNNKGIVLVEVIRQNQIFNVVSTSSLVLAENDRLIFSGKISEILELVAHNKELELSKNAPFAWAEPLKVIEVTVPPNAALEGVQIKDADFRKKYQAAIIAIHRNGEKLSGRIGQIRLKRGDVLLLMTDEEASVALLRKNFYILSGQEVIERKSLKRNRLFLLGLLIGLGLLVSGVLELFPILLLLVILALMINLITLRKLKAELDFNLLAVLVCALALGNSFIATGAASMLTEELLRWLMPFGVLGVLLGLMLFTLLLTSFITNVAAVSVAFPLAYSISQQLEISGEPFYVAVAFMASAAFLTPISYQTNLIVAGPGGYKFKDFVKVGSPLTLIYLLICVLFICIKYNLL